MSILTALAGRFVAGETATDAVAAARALNAEGAKATLNFLGEEVAAPEQAARARDEYLGLLRALAEAGVDAHLSVKPSQLGMALDPALCRENLERILGEAARRRVFVRLDMEGSAYTQKTLDLFYGLQPRYPGCGVVIQAALHRSPEDVAELDRRAARVRLCKGAYKEPESVAAQDREAVNARYDALAEELLARGTFPAFATHDDERIERVRAAARARAVPSDRIEFQMLYGLRPRLWRGLLREGYAVRIYVPYGTNCVGYLWRRLRERKENLAFVLRSLWQG